MFKRIELDNFRSFTHIVFDLEGAGGTPAPYALVYGENGSGKTDLVESVAFLKRSIKTLVPEGVPEYEELSTGISAYAREAALRHLAVYKRHRHNELVDTPQRRTEYARIC